MKIRAVGLALAAMVTLAGGAEAATLADCEGGITMSAPGVVKCAGQTLISCPGGTVIDSTGAVVCSAAPETVPICTLASSAGFVQNAYTLTANCSPAAASYTWSDAGCSSTSKTCTVATTVTKDYTVAGKNSAGTAGQTATVRVTVGGTSAPAPAPAPTPTPTGKPACTLVALEGFLVGKIRVQANCSPVATSYTWVGTGFSNTVSYDYLTTPTTTTSYSVTGCNASGCSAQASTTYTVSAVAPACTVTASASSIAPDGTSTLTASCSPAATGYTWTGGTCAGSTAQSCTVQLASGSHAYTVTGSNAVGTGVPSAAATVTVSPPNCTLTASATSIAPNGTSVLTASCSPAATGGYVWTGGTCVGEPSNICQVTLVGSSQSYTVAGINAVRTGDPSAAVTVTVSPPSCTLTASASTISLGGSSTLTANCTSTPTSYTWTGGTCAGSTTSCTVTPGATTPYTVRATNAAGTSSAAAATVTVIIPGACTLANTNIPITYLTDFGHNFNQRMSRGESVSYQITTPDRESPGGTIVKDNSTIGLPVEGFINVSTSQCDFTYPTLVAPWNTLDATWNGCGNWFASGSLQYHVEYVDSHQIGRCSLRPNTTYYINIRNESQGNLGVDTCPQGVTCGFLFNMNGS